MCCSAVRDGKKRELVSDEGRIGGAVQFAGAFRGCMRGESNGGTDAPWKSSSGALQFRTMEDHTKTFLQHTHLQFSRREG